MHAVFICGVCEGSLAWELVWILLSQALAFHIYVSSHFGVPYFIHATATYFPVEASITLAVVKDF